MTVAGPVSHRDSAMSLDRLARGVVLGDQADNDAADRAGQHRPPRRWRSPPPGRRSGLAAWTRTMNSTDEPMVPMRSAFSGDWSTSFCLHDQDAADRAQQAE